MTTRDLGAVGIKLIGVFLAVYGVMRLVGVAASTVLPEIADIPNSQEILRMNVVTILIDLGIAAACVFGGDFLAGRIFPDRRLELAPVSRENLLVVGIALLGVSAVATAAPAVVEFVAKAIWFAESSRQSQFLPSMADSWQSLLGRVLELIVGGALMFKAGRLGSRLDGLYSKTAITVR